MWCWYVPRVARSSTRSPVSNTWVSPVDVMQRRRRQAPDRKRSAVAHRCRGPFLSDVWLSKFPLVPSVVVLEACNIGKLGIGLGIFAIEQCHLADGLYTLGTAGCEQFVKHRRPVVALGQGQLHLDQLMIAQSSVEFAQ